MKTGTAVEIVTYIREQREATAKELAAYFGISAQALFRHLKRLQDEGLIRKIGSAPRVFYVLNEAAQADDEVGQIPLAAQAVLAGSYLHISPSGELYEGVEGFVRAKQRAGENPGEAARKYLQAWRRYQAHRNEQGLINGLPKLAHTFKKDIHLTELYFCELYSFPGLGRTKLGALLLYGKQGQNRELIKRVVGEVKEKILSLIAQKNIEAVAFIPPTLVRTVQFQKELERQLHLDLPHLSIVKATGTVAVPQKVLSNVQERVENARNTIFIHPDRAYESILLIDDAVGSGATLNETARKLKERGYCTGSLIGLALTGSHTGFDVLNEV